MRADDTGTLQMTASLEVERPAVGPARSLALMAIVLATFGILWPTTASLLERWSDTVVRAYTHGVLIVPIACFMLWQRRRIFAELDAAPSWRGFALGVGLLLLWLLAYRGGVQIAHQALLPLIVLALASTLLGWAITRQALLPISFLFLAIPVWDAINPALQWASTFAVRGVLSLLGIPVYFDGLEFQIPAGRFEIAGGCSGLHFFIVSLAIATFYGDLHSDRLRTRVRLLVLAAGFALVTNWLRITLIIVVGHVTQMRHHLVSEEHYSFGWGMFALAMLIFFLIVRRWPSSEKKTTQTVAQRPVAALPARGLWLTAMALALPALALPLDRNIAEQSRAGRTALPADPAGWSHSSLAAVPGGPLFVNSLQEIREYRSQGHVVQAFLAIYLSQRHGQKLADFNNRPAGEGMRQATRPAHVAGAWRELEVVDLDSQRWLVRLRYRIDDYVTDDLRRAQLVYALGSLMGDPLSSAQVLRTRCEADCGAARVLLDRFAADTRLNSIPPGD